jgi:hypothetical protein
LVHATSDPISTLDLGVSLLCLRVEILGSFIHAAIDPISASSRLLHSDTVIPVLLTLSRAARNCCEPTSLLALVSRSTVSVFVTVSFAIIEGALSVVILFSVFERDRGELERFSCLGVIVLSSLVHTAIYPIAAATIVLVSFRVIVFSLFVEAASDPVSALNLGVSFLSFGVIVLGLFIHASVDPGNARFVINVSVLVVVLSSLVHASSDLDHQHGEWLARPIILSGFTVVVHHSLFGASEDPINTPSVLGSLSIVVFGFFVHATLHPEDTSSVSSGFGIVIACLLIHAPVNPVHTASLLLSRHTVVPVFLSFPRATRDSSEATSLETLVACSTLTVTITVSFASLESILSISILFSVYERERNCKTLSSSLGIVIACLLVHATIDPEDTLLGDRSCRFNVVVSGFLIHAPINPEHTTSWLLNRDTVIPVFLSFPRATRDSSEATSLETLVACSTLTVTITVSFASLESILSISILFSVYERERNCKTLSSSLGIVIACLLVHATIDPEDTLLGDRSCRFNVVVSGFLIHAPINPEHTTSWLLNRDTVIPVFLSFPRATRDSSEATSLETLVACSTLTVTIAVSFACLESTLSIVILFSIFQRNGSELD